MNINVKIIVTTDKDSTILRMEKISKTQKSDWT